MVEKAFCAQSELVHTRPPLAAVFVAVRYRREPAGAGVAREDARSAAEWPCDTEQALAPDLARFGRGLPLAGR